MTIKLILARTNYDAITAWTDIKTVEVNLPLVAQEGWNVIGALDLNWQPARQPVPWQEAIEAWAKGKLVYVENKAGGRVYRQGGEGQRMYLLDSEITTGTWYVED